MKWSSIFKCFDWCGEFAKRSSHRRKASGISGVEITDEEMEELKEHFTSCDKNMDGFISKGELADLTRLLRQEETEERIDAIVKSIDLNKDGLVSFEEFTILFKRLKKASMGRIGNSDVRADAHNAFKVFDRDDDGFITLPEIKLVMSYLGENVDEDKALQMLQMADANQDGKISEEEFVNVFHSLATGNLAAAPNDYSVQTKSNKDDSRKPSAVT